MKALLLCLAFVFCSQAYAFDCEPYCQFETFNISQEMDDDSDFLIDQIGADAFYTLQDLAKTNIVTVKILVDDTEGAPKKAAECEVKIERRSAGHGGVSVQGPVGSRVSGGGGGSGSTVITIKGPCKEVKQLLKAALPSDGNQ